MKKTALVIQHELISTLSRRSYLLLSFGIPLLGAMIFTVVSIVKNDTASSIEPDTGDASALEVEGFVDQAGLISLIPVDIPVSKSASIADILVAYPDEALARQALENGEISAFYIVPDDYVETGNFVYIHPNRTPSASGAQDWIMRRTLLINLLEGDSALAEKVWNPMDLEVINLAPAPQHDRFASEDCSSPGPACESSALVRFIPTIMVVLFFMFITQGSGLLIRNISGEKQNQVVEILMLSVNPQQLLTGKLIGLGIASLLSTMAWLGTGYLILRLGGGMLNLPSELTIPPSLLVWGVVFFILGYTLYASLMAGAGALVPNLKEVSQASTLVLTPMILSYMFALIASGEAPHSGLSAVLSLFPLTAPVVMIMRLTIGGVPLWQPLLAAALMVLTVIFTVRAAAGMFRAQTLLSGQPFNVKRFARALLGQT